MISRRLERFPPRQQCFIEFGGPFDRRAEQGLCEVMEISVGGIEQDDAPILKQPRKEQGKRTAQTFTRTIRLAQPGRNFGISQQPGGALDYVLNLRPELDGPHGRIGHAVTFKCVAFHREWFRKAARGEQRYLVDLGQIVVLGRQPEDRNAVHSVRRRLFRQFDRRQRFEDRKQRPAEETDLLPRNRRQRSAPEPVKVGQRLPRGAPRAILPLENLAHPGATRGVVNNARGLVLHPLGKDRRARIKSVDGRSVGKIIKKQACGVRNLCERQTLRLHRQLSAHLSAHFSINRRIFAIRMCSQSLGSQRERVLARVQK